MQEMQGTNTTDLVSPNASDNNFCEEAPDEDPKSASITKPVIRSNAPVPDKSHHSPASPSTRRKETAETEKARGEGSHYIHVRYPTPIHAAATFSARPVLIAPVCQEVAS